MSLLLLILGIVLKLCTGLSPYSDVLIAISSGVISGGIIAVLSQYRIRFIFILNKNEECYQEIVKAISEIKRNEILGEGNLKARDIAKNFDEMEWDNFVARVMELTCVMRKINGFHSRVSVKSKTIIDCPDFNEIELFENAVRNCYTIAEKEKAISKCMEYIQLLQKIKQTSIETINDINNEINKFYNNRI